MMASNVVGNLVVKLSAHTAEFDTKLGKVGETAKRFASDVRKPMQEANTHVGHLIKTLASRVFGGGNVRLASAFEGIAGPLSLITSIGLGTIAVFTGLAAKSIQFGNELRAALKASTDLGISLAKYQRENNLVQFTEGATTGLMAMSIAMEKASKIAKRIAGEIGGWGVGGAALLFAKSEMPDKNDPQYRRGNLAMAANNIDKVMYQLTRAFDDFNDPLANQIDLMRRSGATAGQVKEAYGKWYDFAKLEQHQAAVQGFTWAGATKAGSPQAEAIIANSQLMQTKFGMGLNTPEERTARALEYWLPKLKPYSGEEPIAPSPN